MTDDPAQLTDEQLAVKVLRKALVDALLADQTPRDAAAIARLLLEASGAIGKHSRQPVDLSDPMHELSRAALNTLASGGEPSESSASGPASRPGHRVKKRTKKA